MVDIMIHIEKPDTNENNILQPAFSLDITRLYFVAGDYNRAGCDYYIKAFYDSIFIQAETKDIKYWEGFNYVNVFNYLNLYGKLLLEFGS